MKKYILSILSLLTTIGMLVSCTPFDANVQSSSTSGVNSSSTSNVKNSNAEDDDSDIINIFNTITSNEMKGRLAGTPENEQAGQIIEDYFKEIGLSPYQDNKYNHEYTAPYFDPYPQDTKLDLTINNHTTTLKLGENYVPSNTINKTSFNLKVTNDKNIKNPKDYAYITSDYSERTKLLDTFDAFILPDDLKSHPRNVADTGGIIRVSNKIYDDMLANIDSVSIEFESEPNIKSGTLKNIVGKISGQSSGQSFGQSFDRALVISAHYDGAGSIGDEIINSAIDNGSGVLSMLKTAKILSKKYSGAIKPTFDIYFVGFNSEEIGLSGSSAFAEELSETYQNNIVNINYDCFSKDHILFLGCENKGEEPFYEDIRQEFSNNNIAYTDDIYSASDHSRFTQQGALALTLGEYGTPAESFVHTPQDTTEKVDASYCINIANIMSNYIYRKGGKLFDFISNLASGYTENPEELLEINLEIEEKQKTLNLKFNEYYTFASTKNPNVAIQIQGHKEFTELSEFGQIFKDIDVTAIPPMLNKTKFIDILPYTDTINVKTITSTLESIQSNASPVGIPVSPSDFNKVMVADISNLEMVDILYTWDDKKTKSVMHNTVTAISNTFKLHDRYSDQPKESITVGNQKYDIYYFSDTTIDPTTKTQTTTYSKDRFSRFGFTINDCKVYVSTIKFTRNVRDDFTKEGITEFIKSIPMSDLEAISSLVK